MSEFSGIGYYISAYTCKTCQNETRTILKIDMALMCPKCFQSLSSMLDLVADHRHCEKCQQNCTEFGITTWYPAPGEDLPLANQPVLITMESGKSRPHLMQVWCAACIALLLERGGRHEVPVFDAILEEDG